jgi:hypothetical protein
MGRFVSVVLAAVLLLIAPGLTGCSSSRQPTPFPVPASVDLLPANIVSIDVRAIQSFTATPKNNKGQAITTPISFNSSNTAVVTVASNGLACAGTWDSLANPQICTPGPVGVAQVSATAQGVSSPLTTVYVHQHIDSIVVNPVILPINPCLSKDQTANYAATAYNRGVDITPSVGTFTWQSANGSVVKLSTTAEGLQVGQVQATASVPGMTSIVASASGVNSVPLDFTTCAVQSITLEVSGTHDNSFSVSKGGSKTITATVVDTLGTTITDTPLTWSSSELATVSVSTSGSASGTQPGSATIIASCTPPACNIGFVPTLPIYPTGVITANVTGTSTSTTVWVTSTGCGTTDGCFSTIDGITTAGNTVTAIAGLPATPNSLVFSRKGDKAYLGTDRGLLGTRGLMVFNPTANPPGVSQFFTSIPGQVLAVSPDGKKVIVSDTVDAPNQVFVLDTTTNNHVAFSIAGAAVADFSPDSLKAFIVAGQTVVNITAASQSGSNTTFTYTLTSGPALQAGMSIVITGMGNAGNNRTFTITAVGAGTFTVVNASGVTASGQNGAGIVAGNTLYVYSALDALQTITLNAPATDVSFLANGIFGYMAGGDPAGVSFLPTCQDPALSSLGSVNVPGAQMIRGLPDGKTLLTLTPPSVQTITATVSGTLLPGQIGCPAPLGALTVTNTPNPADNLGQGSFEPRQLMVSPDGSKAYILTKSLGSVLVFDIINHTTSAIPISGNVTPLQASLTPDGTLLYVSVSDGTVRVLDTGAQSEIQQVSLPKSLCLDSRGDPFPVTCNPDLIAVKP